MKTVLNITNLVGTIIVLATTTTFVVFLFMGKISVYLYNINRKFLIYETRTNCH